MSISVEHVSLAERIEIQRKLELNLSAGEYKSCGISLIGDTGLSYHELGEVMGVCADAPLPRVRVTSRKASLEGAGGIAHLLTEWGAETFVVSPIGRDESSAQLRLLYEESGIRFSKMPVTLPQTVRTTRRVFAGGHQFIHLEAETSIQPSRSPRILQFANRLRRRLEKSAMLGVIDAGESGLDQRYIAQMCRWAQKVGCATFYDARTSYLPARLNGLGYLKVNDNQMRTWFGSEVQRSFYPEGAIREIMRIVGAQNLIYTRGKYGMLLCQRDRKRIRCWEVKPQEKRLYDLVSVGDVVSAALIFMLSRGFTLLEAACFAATAAEYGLDRRHGKNLDFLGILTSLPSSQIESRNPISPK